jgi:PucR family transcriptional regulator, purine catabolism regulatory protein
VTDLAALHAAILPAAVEVGAPTGRTATITWVRLMRARVPAFDALESGDLAIVPAAALDVVAPGEDDIRAFAAACADASVSGVLLASHESGPADAPAALSGSDPLMRLAGALAEVGVPALLVPRADPTALERSVIGFLVTQGAELDRQAALLETRLERMAIDGGGPEALVGAIATFLGRAVALEGRRGDALAVHAPPEVADAATAVTRYHARPRQAVALRFALPAAGGRAGSIALLGDRPVGELERVSVARIAGLLALELSRDEAVRRARDQARRSDALPPAGPPWVVLLSRQRAPGAEDDTPEARERREAARHEIRLIAPARRLILRGDADSLEIRAVLAVDPAGGADPEGLSIVTRIAAFLDRPVAVSRPFSTPVDRPAAEAEARTTLESAERLVDGPSVARASLLPVYQLLVALHNLPDAERMARTLLAPILVGREDVRRERLATLRALLDHGTASGAADALGVHRNTIRYRLHRIEEVSGWRLSDPEVRLALGVALRFVHDV